MRVVKATIAGVAAVNIGLLGAVASLGLSGRAPSSAPPSIEGSLSRPKVTAGAPEVAVTSTVPAVVPAALPTPLPGAGTGVQARAVAPPAIANLGPTTSAPSSTTTSPTAFVPSTTVAAPTTTVTPSTSSSTTTATTVPKSTTTTVCTPSGGGPSTTISGCSRSAG